MLTVFPIITKVCYISIMATPEGPPAFAGKDLNALCNAEAAAI
jgi:hypothetical protein